MKDVITKHVKYVIRILSNTKLVPDVGIRMQKPTDKNGMWIGWTEKEVNEFLESIRKPTTILMNKK
jgi:hypothetical protein